MKSRLAVVVLLAATTLAGCSSADTTSSPIVAPPASAAATRPSAAPAQGCDSPGPAVTVTDKDNGSVVCLTTGGVLTLSLSKDWKAAKVDGTVLKAAGASKFTAAVEGKTTITSSRAACPTATKGAVKCGAVQAFQVQVVVS